MKNVYYEWFIQIRALTFEYYELKFRYKVCNGEQEDNLTKSEIKTVPSVFQIYHDPIFDKGNLF